MVVPSHGSVATNEPDQSKVRLEFQPENLDLRDKVVSIV